MARQTGDILLYGTRQDGNGYIDREGRAVFRQKPGPSREAWKRKPAFPRTRMAAAEFGERMESWWALWRRVPKAMRLLVVGKTGGAPENVGLVDDPIGIGWKGGFAIVGDEVPLGLDVELEGRDAEGRAWLGDYASGGDGAVSALRIWGLGNLESLNLDPIASDSDRIGSGRREFLPVAGHHVTGGMGAARSKERKRVVARYWNAGKGLEDRRELELERWDAIARGKGFKDRYAWFAAMENAGFGTAGLDGLKAADIRVRLHWCVCSETGIAYQAGEWVRLKEMLRVRLPQGLEGALFVGLEFGFVRNLTTSTGLLRQAQHGAVRRPSPSPKEKGAPCVLLPLPCLNRMWYCGMRETVRKYGTRTGIRHGRTGMRHGSTRRLRGRADARGAVRGARVGVVARLCDRQTMCYIPLDALWATVPLPRGIVMCGERDRAGP